MTPVLVNSTLASDRALDATALEWLARLVDAAPPERSATLERLAAENPALHTRVERLLAAADSAGQSHLVRGPMAVLEPEPVVASGLSAGALLGGYRLLHELGRGGMSVVWLAERSDGLLTRSVALKMPLLRLSSAVDRERFARERDVLAALNHPGIARLIDAGVGDAGQPYIVLEFVDGQPLDVACNARRLGLRERLQLFMQVLEAVDHAHKHLVVHRDLKPGNVMVDTEGRVRLLDFGVAKLLDDSTPGADRHALTQAAGCALTPRYAAPEQLDNGTISIATDVYALGVMLFELLCGVSPYGSGPSSLRQWMRAVAELQVPRPSRAATDAFVTTGAAAHPARWRQALAGDLDNIVLKALRKVPHERYGSVERFLDDLQRYFAHRPVAARRPPYIHRARLFMRRHVGASVAGALGTVAALGFAALALHQYRQGVEERVRTETVRDFMFDLVNDAETNEQQPSAEPTGRHMVAAAVARAHDRFKAQPRLQGELLAELGRMHTRLGDDEASWPLLLEAVDLLSRHAPAADATLNKARTYLAAAQVGKGHLESAAQQAGWALARCSSGKACAKARFYARSVMGNIALYRGDLDAALLHRRQGVTESEAGFGPNDSETALAVLGYAITARQAGQLEAARSSLDRAVALSQGVTLRLSDRVAVWRLRAVLSMDLGDYVDARGRLQDAVAKVGSAADRAELWRILSTVEFLLGDAVAARDAADTALQGHADPGAAPDVERLLAHQAHARALSLLGDGPQAGAAMAAVVAGLREAGYSATAMEVLRARRYQAETLLRAGHLDSALAPLQALAQEQSAVQAGQAVEYALTLDMMGSVLRQLGQSQHAVAAHRQAAQLLEKQLPADHPFRQRNQLYAGAAALGLHPTEEASATFLKQAVAYAGRFPPQSLWRRVIDATVARAGCRQAGRTSCGFFL